MQLVVFAALLGLSLARPDKLFEQGSFQKLEPFQERVVPLVIRDDRVQYADGSYSFEFESDDGIKRSEAGNPHRHLDGAVGTFGSISYPLPNGEIFTLKFVANENGYQPESPFLPKAPEFPHPIPQFVLDQIEFANKEKEAAARLAAQEARQLQQQYQQ